MKKDMIKRLFALVLCLILIGMAILPAAATTPEEELEYDRISLGIFWVVFSLLCFALPAVLGIVGIKLARSEARGMPTYWYGLSVVCGAWLLFSVALIVLLLAV